MKTALKIPSAFMFSVLVFSSAAQAETRTIINFNEALAQKTQELQDSDKLEFCTNPEKLPAGAQMPDAETCARLSADAKAHLDQQHERSITHGHAVEAVKPAEPVHPVQ